MIKLNQSLFCDCLIRTHSRYCPSDCFRLQIIHLYWLFVEIIFYLWPVLRCLNVSKDGLNDHHWNPTPLLAALLCEACMLHFFHIFTHWYLAVVTFSQNIGHPYDCGPSPTKVSLISMSWNMSVYNFRDTHSDHLCYEQRHIIHSFRDNLKFVFVENLLDLLMSNPLSFWYL